MYTSKHRRVSLTPPILLIEPCIEFARQRWLACVAGSMTCFEFTDARASKLCLERPTNQGGARGFAHSRQFVYCSEQVRVNRHLYGLHGYTSLCGF